MGSALLVIDLQLDLVRAAGDGDELVDRVAALIARARAASAADQRRPAGVCCSTIRRSSAVNAPIMAR
jgi:hypothetical protein